MNSEKDVFTNRWKGVKKELERIFSDSQRKY